MGSGVSVPTSVADALAKGFSQEEIDAYLVTQKEEKHAPLPDPAASAGAGSSNFILKSTKHVTVETGELDKADQRFATGKWCLPKDFAVLSKLRAYRLKVRKIGIGAHPALILISVSFHRCLSKTI